MAIQVRGVSKRFGDAVALENVDLDVPTGSLTALLGPSGGGKSTLLRVVAGLETPDAGTVFIDGEDVTRLAPRDRGIGFCFQHYAPFRHMTVWDNVAFGLKVRRRPKSEVRKRVKELLELVRLEGFAKRYPSQLSGGQRQRMALARALAGRAAAPAVARRAVRSPGRAGEKELRAWLRRLHDEVHITTVLVTHDQEEAMDVADRLAVINLGQLEQVGTSAELYDNPVNDFVLTFVGPATKIGGEWVRPHDLSIARDPSSRSYAARVARVTHLGFEVRADLEMQPEQASVQAIPANPTSVWVQLDRETARRLDLRVGEVVYVSHRQVDAA